MTSFERVRRIARAGSMALATAVVLGATALPVQAQDYTMKIGFTTINDIFHTFAKRYAEEIEARSDGKIDVELYPAGQLGTAARQIEGLQFGTQEVFISPPGFFAGIHPGFQVLDAPGVFESIDHAHAIVTDPEFQEAYMNLAEPAGIQAIALAIYGPTSIASVKPIEDIGDVEGFKTRVLASPLEQELASALGMTGVSMDFTEALPALQTGTIDAVRTSLVVMGGMKFYDTATYAIKEQTGMILTGVFASKMWLDQLPEDLRKIVVDTAHEMQDEATQIAKDYAAKADKEWTDAGVTLVTMSDEERQQLFEKVRPIGEKVLGSNERIAPVWEALKAAVERHPAE